jgi:hypothetical protein
VKPLQRFRLLANIGHKFLSAQGNVKFAVADPVLDCYYRLAPRLLATMDGTQIVLCR